MSHLSTADRFSSSWSVPSKVARSLRLVHASGQSPWRDSMRQLQNHWRLLVMRMPSTAGYAWLLSMERALGVIKELLALLALTS